MMIQNFLKKYDLWCDFLEYQVNKGKDIDQQKEMYLIQEE